MTNKEYTDAVKQYDHSVGSDWYYALGLLDEAGEVAELVKKHYRSVPWRRELSPLELALELGDVLWYIVRLGALYGFDLDTLLQMNYDKLAYREAVGPQ